jgi:elongation factor P--beta-lysine ligase
LRHQFGDAEFDRPEAEGRALGVDKLVDLVESG